MGTSSTGTGYEHLFDLSKGGMGQVALAVRRDGRFTRLYAVKRLLPSLRDDEQAREMFLEEGRLAGLLHHPNVVGVTDVGEDDQGPYLVMDYIEGISARDLAVHARRSGVPLSIAMVCTIGAQTARGLSAAHELRGHDGSALQLVHRDVSPHNILLGFDGVARIADFGIARALGREHRTSTGVLKGKLGYMAPEMLQFREPTAKTDLFALGVVLYEMIALERLYGGGKDTDRAHRIVNEPPPDIGDVRDDVPAELQALLLRLLAKEPGLRPESAREVAETLEAIAAEAMQDEGPTDVARYLDDAFARERSERHNEVQRSLEEAARRAAAPSAAPKKKKPLVALALGLALALASVALAWAWPRDEPAPEFAPEAETVRISLVSTPPHAVVVADDLELPPVRTPGEMWVTRGDEAIALRFTLEGYEPYEETIRPGADLQVHVRLTARVQVPEEDPDPEPEATMRAATRSMANRPRMRPLRRTMEQVAPTKMRGFELFD